MTCAPTITNGTPQRQHGSESLGSPGISPAEPSMIGQFEMFALMTCETSTSAISLPELADGRSPCASPDTSIFGAGRDRRPASHSVSPAEGSPRPTNVISRPSGSISSASADRSSFSESKLQMPSDAQTKKTCTVCQMTKSLTEFRKWFVGSRDGYRPLCKPCQRTYEMQWRAENRERLRLARAGRAEQTKVYSLKHREKYRARVLIAECRRRCAKKGIAFDLDQFEAQIQARIDKGVCELTGLSFDLTAKERAFSPSLDRIEAGGPYTHDNIRIVIFAVNALLGNWGESIAESVCAAFSTRSQRGTASQRLQSGLSARLRERLGEDGSMIYSMRWRGMATPAGRLYCQLVASARRISESDCFSERSGWTTPQAHDTSGRSIGQKAKHGTKHGCACLVRDAELSGWPTPAARDWRSESASDAFLERHLAHPRGKTLPMEATTMARGLSEPVRITADGKVLTGSDAEMASSGQLNPSHSRWLMGYPLAWDQCAMNLLRKLSRK